VSDEKEKTKEELLKENSDQKAEIEKLNTRIKELDVPYMEVTDKLYWLEFGVLRLTFNSYDELVDSIFELQEEDSEAEIVLWELSRTKEQMKAGDMRIKLPEILGEGITRAKLRRKERDDINKERQIRELLSYKLEIPKIASIVGVDEKRVKEVQKAIKDE